MKSFFKSLKRQDGFTLVELMVVVAIIGLLSAVAIPNFKKYQAKAKMSEAKLQLSAAYTAESSFFSDFNIYHSCLAYMGFNPSPEKASRYYTVGINVTAAVNATASASAGNSGLDTAVCTPTLAAADNVTYFIAGKGVGSTITTNAGITNSALGTQATTTDMTFKIGAAGIIDGAFTTDATSSYVTIDHAKVILVVRQGY